MLSTAISTRSISDRYYNR